MTVTLTRCCACFLFPVLALSAGVLTVLAQSQPAEPATTPLTTTPTDPTIAAIRNEGLNHSQVMQTLDYLCNVIGPRLTGSPELKRANEWTKDQLVSYGLSNAHLESWGPFGKGWTLKRFSLEVIAPSAIPIRAYPKAWSSGLASPIETGVIFIDAQTDADLSRYQGTLKGQVVLIGNPRNITPAFQPLATRFAAADLAKTETFPAGTPITVAGITAQRGGRGAAGAAGAASRGGGGRGVPAGTPAATTATAPIAGTGRGSAGGITQRAFAMAASEGAALILDSSSQGDGGVIFVAQASLPTQGRGGGGSVYSLNAPAAPPQATVAIEDYDRIVRMIRQGQKLTVAVTYQAEFTTADPMAYNTIAEVPGSDLKDQIVMAGGHLDSWHAGTGATDNAAGCSVVMEAVRILEALHLQPRRTIRVALWSGEEQGLYGSASYVAAHFTPASPGGRGGAGARGGRGATATATAPAVDTAPPLGVDGKPIARGAELEKFSIYFNLDNGTGRIRGIYGQGNVAGGPILKKWLAPFADLSANTVTLGTNGQTDHVSFDNAGLPAFQFIQDSIDYMARTHHSSADVYERLQPEDLKIDATILAAMIWQAANADDRFPRRPAPAGRGRGTPPTSDPASQSGDSTLTSTPPSSAPDPPESVPPAGNATATPATR